MFYYITLCYYMRDVAMSLILIGFPKVDDGGGNIGTPTTVKRLEFGWDSSFLYSFTPPHRTGGKKDRSCTFLHC